LADAWHGPSVREVLAGVTADQAARRAAPEVHSVWELVQHVATWQEVVRRRLAGEIILGLTPEQDWQPVPDTSDLAWQECLRRLERSYQDLQSLIALLPEERLDELVPGKGYSVYVMLHGVIQHDLYHAGQMAAVKKLGIPNATG
jgi:uncharacterized damage-inducible protein DinB